MVTSSTVTDGAALPDEAAAFSTGLSAVGANEYEVAGNTRGTEAGTAAGLITAVAPLSAIRSLIASALNPPKTTECTAPIRVQASIAIAASGIVGK